MKSVQVGFVDFFKGSFHNCSLTRLAICISLFSCLYSGGILKYEEVSDFNVSSYFVLLKVQIKFLTNYSICLKKELIKVGRRTL